MELYKFPLGQLKANCYFLVKGNECLIIDPADEAHFILEELQRRKLRLIGMLATHGHFDHVMAAGEIQLSFDVPFYIHEKDLFLLKRLKETAEHFLEYVPTVIEPIHIMPIHDTFTVSGFPFTLIHTPGHTPGSCCFYFADEHMIFTGDTIFKEAIGRYDFSYSNKVQLYESIHTILQLPGETIIYSGHGEETTIGSEGDLRQ